MTHKAARALSKGGFLDPDRKYELIDGVLYEMPADGRAHTLHKSEIIAALNRALAPEAFVVIADATLALAEDDAPAPDVWVYPAQHDFDAVTGRTLSLVVEVADTSVGFDTTDKARLYAGHEVRDYWVVDIEAKVTHVFRGPAEDGTWAERTEVPFAEPLRALLIPDLSLTIADLPRLGG